MGVGRKLWGADGDVGRVGKPNDMVKETRKTRGRRGGGRKEKRRGRWLGRGSAFFQGLLELLFSFFFEAGNGDNRRWCTYREGCVVWGEEGEVGLWAREVRR